MNTDRAMRRLVLTASLLSILTYAIADESWPLGVVAIMLSLIGWTITERRAGRAVPRAVIAIAITVAILWAIASGLRSGLSVANFCQFTIAVMVVKAFDRRTSADLGQSVMLSLFLSIGALLTSNTLWMAVALAPTLAYCVAAGVAFQFHKGRAAARPTAPHVPAAGHATAPPKRIRGIVRTIAGGWAVAATISLVVFAAFPRSIGADSFGRWGNAAVGMMTGFTSEVNLGEGGLISTSSVPVLDLTVRTAAGQSIGAPEETFYLRGAVLDEYRNGSWTSSAPPGGMASPHQLPAGVALPLAADHGAGSAAGRSTGTRIELDIMVRNIKPSNAHIFTVWRPRAVEFESQAIVAHAPRTGVILRSGQGGRTRYRVVCEPLGSPPGAAAGGAASRRVVSFDNERIRALAADILRAAGLDPDPDTRPPEDDGAAAAAILRHFDDRFSYSLDIARAPRGRDPIEWFLLEERRGHCEYFASAMAALCRAVGVNSRVVTGYVATEFNDATRHYVVRESNAHAWVEVEVAPGHWQTRDPTPSGEFRRIHRPEPTIASRLRDLFEAVNYAWITSVVAFDEQSRASLVSAMRIDAAGIDAWTEDASRRIRSGGRELMARAIRNALVASVTVACLGVAWLFGWPLLRDALRASLRPRWLRLRAALGRRTPRRDPDAALYARLLAALSRRGVPKPEWSPPLAHAATIPDPALSQPAARIAHAIYRVRYGKAPLAPEDHRAVMADLAAIEAAPRRARPGPAPDDPR